MSPCRQGWRAALSRSVSASPEFRPYLNEDTAMELGVDNVKKWRREIAQRRQYISRYGADDCGFAESRARHIYIYIDGVTGILNRARGCRKVQPPQWKQFFRTNQNSKFQNIEIFNRTTVATVRESPSGKSQARPGNRPSRRSTKNIESRQARPSSANWCVWLQIPMKGLLEGRGLFFFIQKCPFFNELVPECGVHLLYDGTQ